MQRWRNKKRIIWYSWVISQTWTDSTLVDKADVGKDTSFAACRDGAGAGGRDGEERRRGGEIWVVDKEVKKDVGHLGPIFTKTKPETRTRGTMKRKSLAEEHADILHFPSTSSSPISLSLSIFLWEEDDKEWRRRRRIKLKKFFI